MKKNFLLLVCLLFNVFTFAQDKPEFTSVDIDAEFPGGVPAWTAYMSKALNKKSKELRKSGEQGTVVILFVIDKNGNVTNIKALDCASAGVPRCLPPNSQLAATAIDIISNSPAWKPASQNGKAVKAYRRQPVSFILQ